MPDPVPLGMRPRRYRHLLVMSLDRSSIFFCNLTGFNILNHLVIEVAFSGKRTCSLKLAVKGAMAYALAIPEDAEFKPKTRKGEKRVKATYAPKSQRKLS
jgi:hypothetical protein